MRAPAVTAAGAADLWTVDLVEDVDVGGWLVVPPAMDERQQRDWVATSVQTVLGLLGPSTDPDDPGPVEPVLDEDVRPVVQAALGVRAATEAVAVFQLWPLRAPAALMCQINLVPSADMPRWAEVEGVVLHAVEAAHLGPGLQCAVARTDDADDGERVELVSLHLIFDDGTTTLVLSLQESVALLVSAAMPALRALADVITVRRGDGSPFVPTAPAGFVQDEPWQFEETP